MITDALLATVGTPEGLYGRRKMTHWLRREGHDMAFCTIDRLMQDLGMNGVRRGRQVRTTIPGKDGHRAGDLLDRDFTAPAPNTRWVADFTYCRTWAGSSTSPLSSTCSRNESWAGTPPATGGPIWSSPRCGSPYGTATARGPPWNPASCCTTPMQEANTPRSSSPTPGARGHRALDRDRWGRLRQRPDGVDHRAVQDRVHRHGRLPRRPLQDAADVEYPRRGTGQPPTLHGSLGTTRRTWAPSAAATTASNTKPPGNSPEPPTAPPPGPAPPATPTKSNHPPTTDRQNGPAGRQRRDAPK